MVKGVVIIFTLLMSQLEKIKEFLSTPLEEAKNKARFFLGDNPKKKKE